MNFVRGNRWLSPLVAWPALRRRLIFHLRQAHFAELGFAVPIGGGLVCPILEEENLLSFSEIFGEGEYEPLFAEIGLPRRWIDIGAHCGYFSLQVASRLLREHAAGWEALLVEPDPRRGAVLTSGLAQRALAGRLRWLPAAVGAPGGRGIFALRDGMGSSLQSAGRAEPAGVPVPIADEAKIVASFDGPYDLIKVDVEGGEFDFARHYGGLLRAAKAVVVEWHAPAADAPCVAELRSQFAACGLGRVVALRDVRRITGQPFEASGLELFCR